MRQLRLSVVLAVLAALMLVLVPVGAQEDELPVLILPIDGAQFLPGTVFDFRVEVHTQEVPENFAITINGTPAAEFFGAEGEAESWEFGGDVVRFNNEGVAPEGFTVDQIAGDYYNPQFGQVTITVEGETITATIGEDTATLEATDDSSVYTIVGGAADGLTATFGFNIDGELTGFDAGGVAQFGVLAGDLPTPASSLIWRNAIAPEAGEYTIEVTAGGTTESVTWVVREPQPGEARNVILFIGDGVTIPMITAARASRGIEQGRPLNYLSVDSMDVRGFVSTSSVDSLMADSANTASALNTGHIGSVNATGTYSDTSPDALDDPRVETFASMIARTRGMSVGVVTTADFSDATPAAVWAHGRNRTDRNRAEYVVQALESGYLDVLLGGGARRLLPQSVEGSRRSDDRDMFAEFEEAGWVVVDTATALEEALAGDTLPEQLLGVFHPSDLNVWLDRNIYTDNLGDFTDQPGLVDMTLAALEVLNQNENGFYLEVEAASVDKQIHPLDQERALSDLIELDQAIAAAREWVAENAPDTLIVVTADHGHGYEVYGTVDVEEFNAAEDDTARINAIGIYNGAGYPDYPDANGDGFPEWEDATVVFAGTVNNHGEYTENFQVSPVPRVPSITNDEGQIVDNPDDDPNGIYMSPNVPSNTGVHTLMDNPVYASGPGAEYFNLSAHQREIFFGMAAAIGLDPSAEDGMVASSGELITASVATPGSTSGLALLLIGLVAGLGLSRVRRK
ncbi:MAG: alkaline phosphatase [bacterium]|nr:alkaline phosphatase [bacterium]